MRGRAVIAAMDDALILARNAPVLFARMSRAGANCLQFAHAYDAHCAGFPVPHIAFLDAPKTGRLASRRHEKNRAVRVARRHNRKRR